MAVLIGGKNGGPPLGALSNTFIPLTVGVLLLAMLVMQLLAIGEFKKLRR